MEINCSVQLRLLAQLGILPTAFLSPKYPSLALEPVVTVNLTRTGPQLRAGASESQGWLIALSQNQSHLVHLYSFVLLGMPVVSVQPSRLTHLLAWVPQAQGVYLT